MAKAIKKSPAKRKAQSSKVKAGVVREEPIILVTNDDGITAPGIHSLVEAVKDLGKIVVVAPDKPQSGMGHAITIGHAASSSQGKCIWGCRSLAMFRHTG
jgi:5'-nucleotidase